MYVNSEDNQTHTIGWEIPHLLLTGEGIEKMTREEALRRCEAYSRVSDGGIIFYPKYVRSLEN